MLLRHTERANPSRGGRARPGGAARAVAGLVLALVLAGCSTATTAPSFPPNYRELIASDLVLEYERDHRGPAEITLEPLSVVNAFAAATTVWVRYRVRPAYLAHELLSSDGNVWRCIQVRADANRPQSGVVVSRPVVDRGTGCPGSVGFTRFTELEKALERVEECRIAANMACTVSEPGAEPRRILRLRPAMPPR